jgi:hypothetical protein
VFLPQAMYVLVACFAFGLLWSALVPSVLGAAALGLLSVSVVVGAGLWFFWSYLPHEWGPYIMTRPARPLGYSSILHMGILLFLAAWPFVRYPVLEGRRRLLVTVTLLVGLLVLSNGWSLTRMTLLIRPVLDRAVAETGVVDGGRYRYFIMSANDRGPGGLWIEPSGGGPTKLVARGKVYRVETKEDALIFRHMGFPGLTYTNWQVQFPSLRLKRLPDSPVYSPGTRPGMELSS